MRPLRTSSHALRNYWDDLCMLPVWQVRLLRRTALTMVRASGIVREGGFAGYAMLAYSEGIESEVIGAYRYAEGTIRINRK